QLLSDLADARRRLEAAERVIAQQGLASVLEGAAPVEGAAGRYYVVAAQLDAALAPSIERLREASDWLRDKLGGPSVLLLASVTDARPQLLVSVSQELTKNGLHAGKLLQEVAHELGGRGGGRPDMAQGGGGDPAKLEAALNRGKRAAMTAGAA
ncbi:MAG TPA: DHHA1 domain-containing protein, partial [Chloroflexota bacterium]|nr:DHHA1 domain-containing protein [Chloroflexota bacterium]